jgi:hypothetical protein
VNDVGRLGQEFLQIVDSIERLWDWNRQTHSFALSAKGSNVVSKLNHRENPLGGDFTYLNLLSWLKDTIPLKKLAHFVPHYL